MLNDRHTNLSRMLNAPVKPPSLQESLQRQRRPQPQPIVPGMPSTPAPSVPTPTGYNPRKEQLFASLLGQGMRPVGSMGSHWEGIGNLAKVIAGSIGGARQDKAKQEEISRFEAGEAEKEQAKRADYGRLATLVGLPREQAALAARNPDFIDTLVQANQPQADPLAKPFSQPMERYNPETGERGLAMNPGDMQQLYARGYTDEVPEPVEPQYGRYVTADGQAVTATMEEAREQNLQPIDEFQANRQFDAQQTHRAAQLAQAGSTEEAGPPELKDKQAQAVYALNRVIPAAHDLFNPGPDGLSLYDSLGDKVDSMAAGVPIIGNELISGQYQQARNLTREIVGSALRYESGGAITDPEIEDMADRYTPQPGDTRETIAQKRRGLENMIQGLRVTLPEGAEAYLPQMDQQSTQPAQVSDRGVGQGLMDIPADAANAFRGAVDDLREAPTLQSVQVMQDVQFEQLLDSDIDLNALPPDVVAAIRERAARMAG